MITVQEDQVSSHIPALLHQIALESIEGEEPLLRRQVVGPRGPLIAGSSMVAFYVAPPVHQPDAFSTYDTGEHVVVSVWLVPITHAEAHYVFDNVWSKFEDLLIQLSPDLSDFSREPICP